MQTSILNNRSSSQIVGEPDALGQMMMKTAEENHKGVLVNRYSKADNSSLLGSLWKLVRRIVGFFCCCFLCCPKTSAKKLDGRVAQIDALLPDFYAACKAGNAEEVNNFFDKIPARFTKRDVKGSLLTYYPHQEGLMQTLSGSAETKEARLAVAKLLMGRDCKPGLRALKINEEGVGRILTSAIESEDYDDFFPLFIEGGADINAGYYPALSAVVEAGDLVRLEYILGFDGIDLEKPSSYPPLQQVFGLIKKPERGFSLDVCCSMANRLLANGAQISAKTISNDHGYGPTSAEKQVICEAIIGNGKLMTSEIAEMYYEATRRPA